MDYITMCIIPCIIGTVISCFFVVNVCMAEKYDGKTTREIRNKKLLVIVPRFIRYMRLRTEIICFVIEIFLCIQIICGTFFLKEYIVMYRKMFFDFLLILNGILFLGSGVPSYISIFANFVKKEREMKEECNWKQENGMVEQVFKYPRNNMIREIKITYNKNYLSETAVLLLGHSHKLNYDGYLKSNELYFGKLKSKYPFMENEDIILGNEENYKEKVSKSGILIERIHSGFFVHNYGNYKKIIELISAKGMFGIRASFFENSDKNEYQEFEKEMEAGLEQIKAELGIKKIILAGHGLYGTIEAILLSDKIESVGICLLGGIHSDLSESIHEYLKKEYKYYAGISKKRKEALESRMDKKICSYDSCAECFCMGICEKRETNYFKSLKKYNFQYLKNNISMYKNPILYMEFSKNMFLKEKDNGIEFQNSFLEKYIIPDVHFNMREKKGQDFPTIKDITRYELVQKCRNNSFFFR